MKNPKFRFISGRSDSRKTTTDVDEVLEQNGDLHFDDRNLLNSLLNYLPEYIYFKDNQSRFIRISRSLAVDFGLDDPSQAIGKSDFDFFSSEHAEAAFKDEQEILRTGKTISKEEKETWPNRSDSWVLTTKMPLYDEQGKIIGTFGTSSNITNRKLSEDQLRLQSTSLQKQIREINLLHEQLKEQAYCDALTGLFNRRLMDEMLTQQLEQCRGLKIPFSIFIIDIDNFKKINDEFGHLTGDSILQNYGMCIKAMTRTDDFSCRFGGDEILMAFQNMPLRQAMKKAQTICKKLSKLYVQNEDQQISTTVSIGVAVYPNHGDSVRKLINQADAALYLSKEMGRCRVTSASEII